MKKFKSVTTVHDILHDEITNELGKMWNSYRTMKMHKRQVNAAVGGLMPLLSHGYYLLWVIYFIPGRNRYFNQVDRAYLRHGTIGYFIGSTTGALIGYFLVQKLKKTSIYILTTTLVIISGICALTTNLIAIIISDYLNGIGNGLALLTLFFHLPEVASKHIRGAVVTVISVMIAASLYTASNEYYTIIDSMDKSSEVSDFIPGLFLIIYGTLGLVFLPYFTLESPVYFIQNNQDKLALDVMLRLRLETHENAELHRDFKDLKDYIDYEGCSARKMSGDSNIFWKILLLRMVYTISSGIIFVSAHFMDNFARPYSSTFMFSGRLLAELLSMYFIERIGRKMSLRISLFGSGFLATIIAVASLYYCYSYNLHLTILIILYQAFIGIGLGPVSTVYISELFIFRQKRFYVAAVLIIENLVQVLCLTCIQQHFDVFTLLGLLAIMLLSSACVFERILPETKGLSLKECVRSWN